MVFSAFGIISLPGFIHVIGNTCDFLSHFAKNHLQLLVESPYNNGKSATVSICNTEQIVSQIAQVFHPWMSSNILRGVMTCITLDAILQCKHGHHHHNGACRLIDFKLSFAQASAWLCKPYLSAQTKLLHANPLQVVLFAHSLPYTFNKAIHAPQESENVIGLEWGWSMQYAHQRDSFHLVFVLALSPIHWRVQRAREMNRERGLCNIFYGEEMGEKAKRYLWFNMLGFSFYLYRVSFWP